MVKELCDSDVVWAPQVITEGWFFSADLVTPSYLQGAIALTGRTNASAWRCMRPGEVLFVGFKNGGKRDNYYMLYFSFRLSPPPGLYESGEFAVLGLPGSS